MRMLDRRPRTGRLERPLTLVMLALAATLSGLFTAGPAKAQNSIPGSEPRIFKGHTNTVFAVTFAPDSQTFATAGKDKTIRIWDVASGKRVAMLRATDTIRAGLRSGWQDAGCV